uniref:MADF domain-containing protein n=1 Tax=Parascaris univalens TaxID=6257 RepID=A0A915AK87_PARUN
MESAQSPSPLYHQENDSDLSYLTNAMDEPEPSSFNLRLIEAVRNSRCLYDAKDRQYRSADHKIKVWNRLVQILQFDGDARTLYNRWKQLRDKYGKEKKKIKYTGDQTGWQYFKHLTFLDPHMVDRQQQQYARAKDGKGMLLSPGGTAHQIVITDPNFSSNLIHEVQLHPCLYDIRDPKYRHSDYRNQAWAEIIKNLNFPGDINSIYKQWKKVRDRYVREKRKMRMSNAASGEADESQWDLFPQMMWIDPFLDDRATHVKRKRDSDELSDDGYLDDMVDPQHHATSQHGVTQLHSPYATMVLHADPHQGKAIPHLHQGAQNAQQRIPIGQLQGNVLLQQHDMHAIDGDKAFALSVTADMRALPEHARAIAKAQIQNWLDSSRLVPQMNFEVK